MTNRRVMILLVGLTAILAAGFAWSIKRMVDHNTASNSLLETSSEVSTAPEISLLEGDGVPMTGNEIMRISDIDFDSYSKDLARFINLEMTEPLSTAVPKIERYFAPTGGDSADYANVGTQTETSFSSFDAEGGKVMVVERINMRDDSVKAEQFYAIFKKFSDAEVLVDYGSKIKCARGANTTQWQTELCP